MSAKLFTLRQLCLRHFRLAIGLAVTTILIALAACGGTIGSQSPASNGASTNPSQGAASTPAASQAPSTQPSSSGSTWG